VATTAYPASLTSAAPPGTGASVSGPAIGVASRNSSAPAAAQQVPGQAASGASQAGTPRRATAATAIPAANQSRCPGSHSSSRSGAPSRCTAAIHPYPASAQPASTAHSCRRASAASPGSTA
jgi:hypothetical protein